MDPKLRKALLLFFLVKKWLDSRFLSNFLEIVEEVEVKRPEPSRVSIILIVEHIHLHLYNINIDN